MEGLRNLHGSLRPSWFIKDFNVATELDNVMSLEEKLSRSGSWIRLKSPPLSGYDCLYQEGRRKGGNKSDIIPYGGHFDFLTLFRNLLLHFFLYHFTNSPSVSLLFVSSWFQCLCLSPVTSVFLCLLHLFLCVVSCLCWFFGLTQLFFGFLLLLDLFIQTLNVSFNLVCKTHWQSSFQCIQLTWSNTNVPNEWNASKVFVMSLTDQVLSGLLPVVVISSTCSAPWCFYWYLLLLWCCFLS